MEDCVNGEDEDHKHCAIQDGKTERKGRKVEPRLYTIYNLVDEDSKNSDHASLSNMTFLVIFLATLVMCVGLCIIIIFAILRYRRQPKTQKSIPALERQISTGSANTYGIQEDSPNTCEKQSWIMKTCLLLGAARGVLNHWQHFDFSDLIMPFYKLYIWMAQVWRL